MDKLRLKKCMLYTFVWGIIAHAYGFLNFTISYDSLKAFYSGTWEIEWKISLGRVFVPLYRLLTRGILTMPWLIGLLSLFWLGISAYFIADMLHISSSVSLIAATGILTTNKIVAALTASFLHDMDVDMFALFMMAAAVYLWKKGGKKYLLGVPLITIGLGLYQSYLSVAITLVIMILIMELMKGDRNGKQVLREGIKACFMCLLGGFIYLLLVSLISHIVHQPISDSYNSISQIGELSAYSVVKHIVGTYYFWIVNIIKPLTLYPSWVLVFVNILLVLYLGMMLFRYFLEKRGTLEKVVMLLLILCLPLGMNISYVMSNGVLHDLMMYATVLTYLLIVLIGEWMTGTGGKGHSGFKAIQRAVLLLTGIVLWNNISVANAAYLKKDVERQQVAALMTQVVVAMEARDDYVRGETPVAFIGDIEMDEMKGFEMFSGDARTSGMMGLADNSYIKNYEGYYAYFRYILDNPANLCDEEKCLELEETPSVREMPVFPNQGSMRMQDGVLIVKMGEK